MNSIRCPGCSNINAMSALECKQCGFPFSNLPPTAYVSAPTEEVYYSQNPNYPPAQALRDNETGRKALFWYRFYLGVMVVLYLFVAAMGVFLAVARPTTPNQSAEEVLITGIVYAILGVVFGIVFAVALFLPRKPWNWVVAIVMIALGLTSCCMLPFLIPLLIYWVKPETKAYFGRN